MLWKCDDFFFTCLLKIFSDINLYTYMNTVLEVTRTNNFVCFAGIGKTQVLKIFRFENKVVYVSLTVVSCL